MAPVRVTMLLADFATVADGKLTIVGGGWSVVGPDPQAYAIAIKIEVPWDTAAASHAMRLELVDADGRPIEVPSETGWQPLVIEGEFETGRPDGVKPGTPLDFMVAFSIGAHPLPPGGRCEWRLAIDGETEEDWHVAFTTRPASYGARPPDEPEAA